VQQALDVQINAYGVQHIHSPDWNQARCDLCNADRPAFVLPVSDFIVPDFPEHTSAGGWAASPKGIFKPEDLP
jgi:hypothetical protein